MTDKLAQPAPQKTAPTPTRRPTEPAPNPTKPRTEPTPKTSTVKPPQLPKNDKKSVRSFGSIPSCRSLLLDFLLKVVPAVLPERPGQEPAPANSRPVKSQTPQNPVASTNVLRPPKPSPRTSGSQTKARVSKFDGPAVPHVNNLNNNPAPVVVRPQTVVVSSMAISAITQDNAEPALTQQIPSSPSTSGTSPSRRQKRHKKKVRYIYYLGYSGDLTGHHINRFRHRRIQQ